LKHIVGALVFGMVMVCGCGGQARPSQSAAHSDLSAQAAPRDSAQAAQPANLSTNGGSSSPSPAAHDAELDRVIARISDRPIVLRQLVKPLVESRGLVMLVNLAQLEVAKQDAATAHLIVTPQDIQKEHERTLERQFKDADPKLNEQLENAIAKNNTKDAEGIRAELRKEREQLLDQLLDNQQISRLEYNLLLEINTYCRKAAEQDLAGKITDEMVKQEFGVEYGETAEARFIQLTNMQEVGEAQRRLQAGQKFEDVARQMSNNQRYAEQGGALPRFSRQTEGLPQSFKDAAFALKPGQVSDPVNAPPNYYLIKLEAIHEPKAVKFESVKDSLRQSMYERAAQAMMEDIRVALAKQTEKLMAIDDPKLKKQYEEKIALRDRQVKDRRQIEEQMRRQRERIHLPTTSPASTGPTTRP